MGDIPAKTDMVSSIIVNPKNGDQIASDTTFTITVQVANLVAGSFTDADTTYYAGPQFLQGGKIVGHTHVTVQDLGNSLNPQTPPDPTQFAFFKGINDAGNGKGTLSADVTGGLPAGNYRVCTMASASNHQPVLMPVAQRGSPDDCTKFTVTGNGNTPNAASNNGAKGQAAAALVSEAVVGATNAAFAAAVIASENAAAAAAAGAATATPDPNAAAAAAAAAAGGKGKGAKGAKGAKNSGFAAATSAPSAAPSAAAVAAAAAAAGNGKGKGVNAAPAATSIPAASFTAPAFPGTFGGAPDKSKGGRFGGRKLRFAKRQFIA
jgi:hypothetical protein